MEENIQQKSGTRMTARDAAEHVSVNLRIAGAALLMALDFSLIDTAWVAPGVL